MKILILLFILNVSFQEMLVTRAYTDYLKAHVDWEVVDYEDNIFRGWTIDEAKALLGAKIPENDVPLPVYESNIEPPESVIWSGNCVHEVRNQNSCGSCWTFGTAGMLSDRCCQDTGVDHGWLSPQELVSCDIKNDGCKGGWPTWALFYVREHKGLVPDSCFTYQGVEVECPNKCEDDKDWKTVHICNCYGLKQCLGVENIKQCLTLGPIAITFYVPRDFYMYRKGIFVCDEPETLGLHSVTATGYATEPKCHWIVRNSWGTYWGDQGYFRMACDSCGMDGKYPNGNVICESVK